MISFDEILNSMKNAYFDECGENPDMQGDLGIRFKAVASELFDLGVYADYVMTQSFLDTATGTHLDDIARECNLIRHPSSKATGKLVFYVDEPAQSDLTIPADTICARKGKKFIQYKTLTDGVIRAGKTYCIIDSQAMECGKDYNCVRYEIDTIVNPCAGISGVRNDGDFVGGLDAETDFAFRQRIFDFIKHTNNGISQNAVENRIRNLEGVLGCCAFSNGRNITFAVKTATDTIPTALQNRINNEIAFLNLFSVTTVVRAATLVTVDAKIQYHKMDNADELQKCLAEYIEGLNVGLSPDELEFETYLKQKLGYNNLGVKVTFSHETIAKNNYAVSGKIEVLRYE